MKNLYRLTDQKLLDLYDTVLFRMEPNNTLCPLCEKYGSDGGLCQVVEMCPAFTAKWEDGSSLCDRWCDLEPCEHSDFLIEIAWPIEAELAYRGIL